VKACEHLSVVDLTNLGDPDLRKRCNTCSHEWTEPRPTEADPPRNVRVVLRDGAEIPLDLRYVGFVDGLHSWESVRPLSEPYVCLRADYLPAKTTIAIDFDGGE